MGGSSSGRMSEDLELPPLLRPLLLWPARLIGLLRLEYVGSGEHVGRRVLTATAQPREQPLLAKEVRFELAFDAEHGTLLRRAAYEDGRRFHLTEALSIRYNVPIDSDRFEFGSP
jgi:hypothetical protein